MKRKLAILCILLISTLTLTATFEAAHAYIEEIYWVKPIYRGYSNLYGESIVAYEEGATVQLRVTVRNYYGYTIDIYAVKIWFDWDTNYTSTECSTVDPYSLNPGEIHVFTITFTAPDVGTASNLWVHTWWVYVEYTHDTTKDYFDYPYYWDYYFVVFSEEQADAWELYQELSAKLYYSPYFYSYEAKLLESKAELELSVGYDQYWMRWDFANAKTHFQTGISYVDQAYSTEASYSASMDEYSLEGWEAEIYHYKAEANATMKEAEAAVIEANAAMIEANATKTMADAAVIQAAAVLNQSYAYLLFGVAAVIFAIGVVIYAARKPKIVTT